MNSELQNPGDTPIGSKLSDAAERTADTVKQSAAQEAEHAKDRVADHVSAVADATEAARDELPDGSMADPLLDQAVAALGQVADHLKDRDLNTLAADVGEFAKRNPALALGGAALVGFAAARFLKAGSAPRPSTQNDDLWSGHLEGS